MIKSKFDQRFEELNVQFNSLPWMSSSSRGSSSRHVPEGKWQMWATSAQNLIKAVFGENSPHYENFVESFKKCSGYEYDVNTLQGIFLSARDDYLGGYVFNVELHVSGEVFGDFVVMAKTALSEGHKDVAAVLASAALEDALKRFASINQINPTDKTMTDVINALKSKGLVSGAQKSLLDAMPKIRNFALHAEWTKISEPDVNSIIGFVEQFLLSNFK